MTIAPEEVVVKYDISFFDLISRLLKNAHLRRSPHPSSLQRTFKYASFLRISGALYLDIFDHPYKSCFFSKLLEFSRKNIYDLYIIMNKDKQPKYATL